MFEVCACLNLRTFAFGHFLAVDREETVDMHKLRKRITSGFQHAWPEQRMKVRDVLADEVMDFGSLALPPIRQRLVVAFAPLPCRCDVADWGIEPNVPVIVGTIRNGESKIRTRTRDVPVSQWVS